MDEVASRESLAYKAGALWRTKRRALVAAAAVALLLVLLAAKAFWPSGPSGEELLAQHREEMVRMEWRESHIYRNGIGFAERLAREDPEAFRTMCSNSRKSNSYSTKAFIQWYHERETGREIEIMNEYALGAWDICESEMGRIAVIGE